jgi:hypothetical protein
MKNGEIAARAAVPLIKKKLAELASLEQSQDAVQSD